MNRISEPIDRISRIDFDQIAGELLNNALDEAKAHLHPLLRNLELDRLDRRIVFVQAFKLVLERRIAENLAAWHPEIQAVYKFDRSWIDSRTSWDSSIHLLIRVLRRSCAITAFGIGLNHSLAAHLKQLRWSRFQRCQSVLELQQLTSSELRHAVSYGAMFCAVYSAPVRIWFRQQSAE